MLVFDVDTDVDVIASVELVVVVVVGDEYFDAAAEVAVADEGCRCVMAIAVVVFGKRESTTPIGPSRSTSDSGQVSSSGAIE